MISHVEGDILKSKSQVIAHGIGPHDHFNQGLAFELKTEWPAMYKDFRQFCHKTNPSPGNIWVWAGTDGRRIACLFTQDPSRTESGHPGSAQLSSVRECVRQLKEFIQKENPASIAIPRLATGVGGLDWTDVEKILNQELGDLKNPIFVYKTYRKGIEAQEI